MEYEHDIKVCKMLNTENTRRSKREREIERKNTPQLKVMLRKKKKGVALKKNWKVSFHPY